MKVRTIAIWGARSTLFVVFLLNVSCALAFVARPEAYASSFEVGGIAGAALIRGMGVLFLMWNATYPLAIYHPRRHRHLVLIIIVQQAIGVAGETWMLLGLPPGHAVLAASGWRFVTFDAGGLLAMLVASAAMQATWRAARHQ